MRVLFAMMVLIASLAAPALAQNDATPWQATITGQVEAFRAGDGEAALSFAGQGFQTQFEGQPEVFLGVILASGYGAIAESRSHSFGEFNKVSDTAVLQVVNFVGRDQSLYEALYQLADEPGEGWRVQSVALRKEAGLGI